MVGICFQKALPYHIYTSTWNWLWDLGRRTAFSLRIISWQVCFVFCAILRLSMGKKICRVAKFCKADSCETDIVDSLMNFLGFIVCRQQLFSIWQVDSDWISSHREWICRHSCVFKIILTTLQALFLMNSEQRDTRKGMFVNLSTRAVSESELLRRSAFKCHHPTTPRGLTGRIFPVGTPPKCRFTDGECTCERVLVVPIVKKRAHIILSRQLVHYDYSIIAYCFFKLSYLVARN